MRRWVQMAKSAHNGQGVTDDPAPQIDAAELPVISPDVGPDEAVDVVGTGLFRLAPIEGSIDRRTLDVDVDLTTDSGVLVLGDLRRAGEKATRAEHHEAAHRIWTVLVEAARRVGNVPLEALAVSRSDAARHAAKQAGRGSGPSTPAKSTYAYDYDALAADRRDGTSQAEVAKRWGCSPGTVARAVRYVNHRDDLLAERPELLRELESDATVAELAARYDTPTKIMRWIVSTSLDRRVG